MNYMDEEYNSRFNPLDRDDLARGSMNRVNTSWNSMNRGSREGMPRIAVDRDAMFRGPRDREGMGFGHIDDVARDQFDRNGLALERRERDDVALGPMQRDALSRLQMDRDDAGRGHVGRDGMVRGRMNPSDLPQGLLDRGDIRGRLDSGDTPWSRIDRDDNFRARLDRDDMPRPLLERNDLPRPLLERNNLPRPLLERNDMPRPLLERNDMPRPLLERNDMPRPLLERNDMPRPLLERNDMPRPLLNRNDMPRPLLDRSNMPRPLLDRDDVPRSRHDQNDMPQSRHDWDDVSRSRDYWDDAPRARLDRDDAPRARLDWDDAPRARLDWDDAPQARLDWDDAPRGPMDRDGMARGPMDRDGMARGPMDRDGMARGPMDRDGMARGPMDREGAAPDLTVKDPVLPVENTKDQMAKHNANRETASDIVKKGKPQGSVDRNNEGQSDMELSDMEMSEGEHSDVELSDVEPSQIKQGNVDQSEIMKGEALIADSADPKKEETAKGDGPEDDKKKYYCEICRLTCLSSMSYQSHIRGQKHMKATRAAENSDFSAITKSKKIKKIEKTLKDYMDEPVREPLIGLEHVLEYRLPGKVEPSYHCELCDFKTDVAPMIEHLNGFKHRRAYISKEFPFLLKAPPGQKEDKVQFLRRMAADIERDEGLKMYRVDVLTKKKKLKSLLEIKPDEIDVKVSRWDNLVPNNEALKAKALLCLETYEVDSDTEAVLVMTVTQDLTENLKTYCLKVKEETEQAEKVARARSVAEALSQTNPAMQPGPETFGAGQFPSDGGNWNSLPNQQTPYGAENKNWHLDPTRQNQPAQFPAGGPNWNRDAMQNQPPLGRGNWNREPMMPNTLRPFEHFGHDPMIQVQQAGNNANARGPPASLARPDRFGSQIRPLLSNEPRGPGGFPPGNRGFGNELNLPDRGPIAGSMSVGPSLLNQPSSLLRNTPLTPGISRLVDVPKGEPVEKFIRGLQNQGAGFKPASSGGFLSGSQSNFSAGSSMMPGNFGADGRIGNVGYSQLMPSNTDRLPLGPPLLRAIAPEKSEKNLGPLSAAIVNRLRGQDVKSASQILASLAASNPALQKVNIGNLLNLLVDTGVIK